ncbi:type VI secretion system-associated protein TagF [Nannocystaceae bacterium ST9]
MSVGLFGKTPSQRDFVRVNIGSPVVGAFDEWLRESVMCLPELRAHLPPEPLPFVFRDPNGAGYLIGVMKGSEDGVGREFPLAVFHQFAGSDHAHDFAGLPSAYSGFITAASELLERIETSDPARWPWLLDQLPLPEPGAVRSAWTQGHLQLAQISSDELLDRLFSRPTGNPEGDRWPDDHAYGMGMLLGACARVANQAPPRGSAITLDCPVTSDTELIFWLELTRRALSWPAPPSFIWSYRQYRLLLVLGSPGPKLLGLLGTPGTFDDSVWPILTDDEEHAARGQRLLDPKRRALMDRPGQSGMMLLDALVG